VIFPRAGTCDHAHGGPRQHAGGNREHFAHCVTRDTQVRQLVAQFGGFKDNFDDMNFTRRYLGMIRARTLIVHGDRDEFFPVSIPAEVYRAITRSALGIVPKGAASPSSRGTRASLGTWSSRFSAPIPDDHEGSWRSASDV
jgi:pimeloyl-ACP methyl ester carboxylesterase